LSRFAEIPTPHSTTIQPVRPPSRPTRLSTCGDG
jgi:hypothetical protein